VLLGAATKRRPHKHDLRRDLQSRAVFQVLAFSRKRYPLTMFYAFDYFNFIADPLSDLYFSFL